MSDRWELRSLDFMPAKLGPKRAGLTPQPTSISGRLQCFVRSAAPFQIDTMCHLGRRQAMTNATLEITYLIRGFRQIVYRPGPDWPGCSFEQDGNFDVTLLIAEADLTPETDVGCLIDISDRRARQLVLAWELQHGHRLELIRRNTALPAFPERDGAVEAVDTLMISDRAEAEIVFAPAPGQMPQVPIMAERWIRTFAEAGDFSDYPEEQLRRHYLVIEELWGTRVSVFSVQDQAKRVDIGLVRDFVSHAECDRKKVVAFISAHLPSAIVAGRTAPTVRFDRLSIEHRNFVGRHIPDSERIARELIMLAIKDLQTSSDLVGPLHRQDGSTGFR